MVEKESEMKGGGNGASQNKKFVARKKLRKEENLRCPSLTLSLVNKKFFGISNLN
jgi:hypothetical protein